VVDEHEWPVPYADPYGDSSVIGGCQHGPLEDNSDTTYLKNGSSAHKFTISCDGQIPDQQSSLLS
jgi:hypothetical protein